MKTSKFTFTFCKMCFGMFLNSAYRIVYVAELQLLVDADDAAIWKVRKANNDKMLARPTNQQVSSKSCFCHPIHPSFQANNEQTKHIIFYTISFTKYWKRQHGKHRRHRQCGSYNKMNPTNQHCQTVRITEDILYFFCFWFFLPDLFLLPFFAMSGTTDQGKRTTMFFVFG